MMQGDDPALTIVDFTMRDAVREIATRAGVNSPSAAVLGVQGLLDLLLAYGGKRALADLLRALADGVAAGEDDDAARDRASRAFHAAFQAMRGEVEVAQAAFRGPMQ